MSTNLDALEDDRHFPLYQPQAQIDAVAACLSCLEGGSVQLWKQIEADELFPGENIGDRYADGCHFLNYFDACRSLSVASILSALWEGILAHEFASLRVISEAEPTLLLKQHVRWKGLSDPNTFWNPQTVWDKKEKRAKQDLVRGAKQLAEAVGFKIRWFPQNLFEILQALYMYRNKVMHRGMEWPLDDCRKITNEIEKRGWRVWFRWHSSERDPWMVHVSSRFADDCLRTAEMTVKAFQNARMVSARTAFRRRRRRQCKFPPS